MKAPRTGILVQARSDSTRLPGKIYSGLPVDGNPSVIERIFARLSTVPDVSVVSILIPENDGRLKSFLESKKIPFFQGSAENVRLRYRDAARHYGLDLIVRATGDNPCVDPGVASDTIRSILSQDSDLLSYSNLPLGVAVEAFTFNALNSDAIPVRPEHREHVSLHIKHNPSFFTVSHLKHPLMQSYADISLPRLTVDTADDLMVARRVYSHLGIDFSVREILELCKRMPHLFVDNAHVQQISFPATSAS